MTSVDYKKAHAIAAATHCLSHLTDLALMTDDNEFVPAILATLDREWPVIAADPAVLAWYRASVEMIRDGLDPRRSSAIPGSAARPAVVDAR